MLVHLAVSFTRNGLSINGSRMGIFRALGIGIFLLIISSLMPTAFTALDRTVVTFLQSTDEALVSAGAYASYAGTLVPAH